MRFLADENVPLPSIRLLREVGLDIEADGEFAPGAPDVQVLSHAASSGRILITFDRDFGELIYSRNAPVPRGVIYVRVLPASPEEPAQLLQDLLALPDIQLLDRFTVLERERVRQRPLLRVTWTRTPWYVH
jgi:predicted nuclease of predicted toxin-antitoxin system